MAATLRTDAWGGSSNNESELLTSYIQGEIKVLEPDLKYAKLGVRRDAPKGFDRIVWPQTNQLPVKINTSVATTGGPTFSGGGSVFGAGASIQGGAAATAGGFPVSSTEGVAAITEGTNPTAIAWGATSYSTGPSQYGILVEVTDLLVHNSAIEVVTKATEQVRFALARLVDTCIQVIVNGGTNGVIYAGAATARTGLGAGDLITQSDMQKAYRNLASSNAAGLKPFSGDYYAAVIHPMVEADLQENTQTGGFLDVGRYSSVDDLRAGKMDTFRGIRYLRSAWQNYFNSTVDVFPTTVVGDQSFGWGFFQEPRAILRSDQDSNDPLALYTSIGGKVTLGATRFEDNVGGQRIVRIESAASS